METPLIASVEFELFPGSTSGKSQGYQSGVRPNHYIHELGCTVIGSVEFANGSIALGETQQAKITYMNWQPLQRVLRPGLEYEVREGNRVVGRVKILKLCATT